MALLNVLLGHYGRRTFTLFWFIQSTSSRFHKKCGLHRCAKRMLISATSDTLDVFTDKMVREKTEKWKCLNTRTNFREIDQNVTDGCQSVHTHLHDSVDEYFRKSIQLKDYETMKLILNAVKEKHDCPSPGLLMEAASIFSRNGDRSGIDAIKSVCQIYNKNEYFNQAEYKHYTAEAIWKNGNVGEALNIFTDVYKNHASLRRKVRSMTKYLFSECIFNRSEASVVLVTNFAKQFADKEGDLYFLSFLWQYLFLSNWFADQKIASELLYQYEGLRTLIMCKIYIIAVTALKEQDVEIVQRLLEVTLQYEMKQQYTNILRTFFDYKCSQGDLKGCSEIISAALALNVPLKEEQHEKFINLLLNYNSSHKWLTKKSKQKPLQKSVHVPSFQLKF